MNKRILIPKETEDLGFVDIYASPIMRDAMDATAEKEAQILNSLQTLNDSHKQLEDCTKLNATEIEILLEKLRNERLIARLEVENFDVVGVRDRLKRMRSGELSDDDIEWIKENKKRIEKVVADQEIPMKEKAEPKVVKVDYRQEKDLQHNPPCEIDEESQSIYLRSALQTANYWWNNVLSIDTAKMKTLINGMTFTPTELTGVSRSELIGQKVLIITILIGDATVWYIIGATAFGLSPLLALAFSAIPMALAKTISLPYVDEIKTIKKSKRNYGSLSGLKALLFCIGLMAVCGGLSIYADDQLTEISHQVVDQTLQNLSSLATISDTELDNTTGELHETNDVGKREVFQFTQTYSGLLLKILMAFALMWTAGVLMARLAVYQDAFDKKMKFLSAREDLYETLAQYDQCINHTKDIVRQIAHIKGIVALYKSKKINFGNQ